MTPVIIGALLGVLLPLALLFAAAHFGVRIPPLAALLLGVAAGVIGMFTGTDLAVRQAVRDPHIETVYLNAQAYRMTRGTRLCLLVNVSLNPAKGGPMITPGVLRSARVKRADGEDLVGNQAFLNNAFAQRHCPKPSSMTKLSREP